MTAANVRGRRAGTDFTHISTVHTAGSSNGSGGPGPGPPEIPPAAGTLRRNCSAAGHRKVTMATTERDVLQGKVLPELQAIASSMGVQGYLRLRKADLIGAIIAKAQGEEFTPSSTPTRSRRAGSSTAAAATGEPADAPADAAPAAVASEQTPTQPTEPAPAA